MKKNYLFNCIFFICLISSLSNSYSQTAKEVVKGMGPGFNLGGVFENGLKTTTFNSCKPIIDLYVAEGMTNVRIPTTWYDYVQGTRLTDANGNINTSHPRFIELVATIDYALSKGLYVVLNTHHEHWLKDNYDGSAYYNNIFSNLWTNIANHFKNYPSKLVFEVLNEPEGVMGQWGTTISPLVESGILYTRQINKVGYDAIRATGGNNTTRIVMISPNGQANDSQIEEVYPTLSTLPGLGNDRYLAMHVHSYDPWNFCGQTGFNVNYPGTQRIISDITICNTHAQNNLGGIAIHYGEFGVGRAPERGGGPQSERGESVVTEYYQTFAKTCKNLGLAFTVWDDRGWFSLINDAGNTFTYNLVPKMLEVVNEAPKVIITTPLSGTVYVSGTVINLTANASDVIPGTVASVSFYDGTTLLGTDTSSPYSFAWTGASVGTHSITARAIDNKGVATTSTPITITVNAPPTVGITSPLTGAIYTLGTSISLAATATDSDGTIASVSFYDGTTLLGTDTSSPYSFTWEGANGGTHSITARATDNNGAVTTSGVVSITVNVPNTPPTVSITAPVTGSSYTSGTSISLAATATDTDGTVSSVSFYDGTTLLGTDTSSPYSFTWAGASVGTHSITAKATDNSGAVSTSPAVSVIVVAPNVAPTVSITSPLTGASYSFGTSISLAATATDIDGTIASVSFYDGITLLNTDVTSPYSFTWAGASVGTHSITAKATDNSGAVSTSTAVAVMVLTPNPCGLITNNSSLYYGGGNVSIQNGTTSPITGFTATITLPSGVTVTSASGVSFVQTGTSVVFSNTSVIGAYSSVFFTYINNYTGGGITPTTVLSCGVGGVSTVRVASPSFYDETKLRRTDSSSPYSFTWLGASVGTHSISAKAIDDSGAVSTSLAENTSTIDGLTTTTIYPNPVDEVIKLKTFVNSDVMVNVTIFDIIGNPVIVKKYEARVGWLQENIDVSELKAGIYILRINQGIIFETKKFIKL